MNPTAAEPLPVTEVKRALDQLGEAVVLRNHDVFHNLASGGDIDLLVADTESARQLLELHLGTPVSTVRRSYVTSMRYRWGHIDLLPDLRWRGAVYLDTATVLANAGRSRHGYGQPALEHEAVASWFSSLLWGGFFKARYTPVVEEAARSRSTQFRAALDQAVGRTWAKRLHIAASKGLMQHSEAWVRPLRRAVLRHALRREPLRTLSRSLAFWALELDLRLRPPLPWLAFLGPDGSGKSSVISALESLFPPSLGNVVRYHWRPHLLDRGTHTGDLVVDPHGDAPRSAGASLLKLAWLAVDWFAGYWLDVAHIRAKQGLVVFDRHYVDLLVDPRRYRYGGRLRCAELVAGVIPRPDVFFVLDAPTETLRARKSEVSAAETDRQRLAYLHLAEQLGNAVVLDATRPPASSAAEVTNYVIGNLRGEPLTPARSWLERLLRRMAQ